LNLIFLIFGIGSFILSFFIHKYFIQFIVLAVFLTVIYMFRVGKKEIDSLKEAIKEHNALLKQNFDNDEGININ